MLRRTIGAQRGLAKGFMVDKVIYSVRLKTFITYLYCWAKHSKFSHLVHDFSIENFVSVRQSNAWHKFFLQKVPFNRLKN